MNTTLFTLRKKILSRMKTISLLIGLSIASQATPVPIIIDTDMLTDCDDAAALAIAHTLQDNGEVEILGVMLSAHEYHNYGYNGNTVSAINHYFHRGNIPIGSWHQLIANNGNVDINEFFRYSNDVHTYMHTTIKNNFANHSDGKSNHQRLSSLVLYTQILEEARLNNQKVKIVVLGQNFNIARLLQNKLQLVKDTVEEIIISAPFGSCNTNTCVQSWDDSYNKGRASTDYVFEYVPEETLLTVSGGEGVNSFQYNKDEYRDIGGQIYRDTGSPMLYAYEGAYQSHYKSMTAGRPLSDQMAILATTISNPTRFWTVHTNGYISSNFMNSSSASWIEGSNNKNHRYFEFDSSKIINLRDTIRNLMRTPPKLEEPEFRKATITSPVSGVTLLAGTSLNLKWKESNGDDKNKVVIQLDNGALVVNDYVFGKTSYIYDIPSEYTGHINVWIYSYKNGEYVDDNDYALYIVKKKVWVPIMMDNIITFVPTLQ